MRTATTAVSCVSVLVIAGATGCGAARISAETRCDDYLSRPAAERHDAAVRISAEIGGVSNAGNPMWGLSLDGACGSHPSMTIGQYFGRGDGSSQTTGEGSNEESTPPPVPPEGPLSVEAKSALQASLGELWGSTLSVYIDDGGVLLIEVSRAPGVDASGNEIDRDPVLAREFEKRCDGMLSATGARGVSMGGRRTIRIC